MSSCPAGGSHFEHTSGLARPHKCLHCTQKLQQQQQCIVGKAAAGELMPLNSAVVHMDINPLATRLAFCSTAKPFGYTFKWLNAH
jgi:hypothetical protein